MVAGGRADGSAENVGNSEPVVGAEGGEVIGVGRGPKFGDTRCPCGRVAVTVAGIVTAAGSCAGGFVRANVRLESAIRYADSFRWYFASFSVRPLAAKRSAEYLFNLRSFLFSERSWTRIRFSR